MKIIIQSSLRNQELVPFSDSSADDNEMLLDFLHHEAKGKKILPNLVVGAMFL